MVLCCLCGTQIEPNPSNMCTACLRSQVDITKDVGREGVVYNCKSCGKYSIDSVKYVVAELESAELLALCLKGIQGLGKGKSSQAKLVDASWIWTEPHSLRLKIDLKLEKEMSDMNNVLIQQSAVSEFVIKSMMCGDCQKETTNQQWKMLVQLRQHAQHKKTLLNLEQQLRKNPLMKQVIDIIQAKNGLDFYFADKPEANKFYETVLQLVPSRKKKDSKSLKGADTKSNLYRYEYTVALEVSPVCRLDLLILPSKVNSSLFAGKASVVICDKVTKSLHFVDPFTGETAVTADSSIFEMQSLLTSKDLTQFVVLDVNDETQTQSKEGKPKIGDVEVARIADFGSNDERYVVRSHLAQYLQSGDTVLGYDLTSRNFADDLLKALRGKELPGIILVKKDRAYSTDTAA